MILPESEGTAWQISSFSKNFGLILDDRHSLVESGDRIVAWPILPRTLRLAGSREILFPTRSMASGNLPAFEAML
ncbi:MAG: hypothetical protein ACLPTZ_20260 [Beijerinckiaceae bacterium]